MRKRFSDPAGTWTDDDARRLLDEWRRSGDTIAAFARRHSVSAWRLYSWRTKLRTTATPGAAPTLSLVPASIVAVSGTTLTLRLRSRGRRSLARREARREQHRAGRARGARRRA